MKRSLESLENAFLRLGVISTEKIGLANIQGVCQKHLHEKTKRAMTFYWDREDPNVWLDIILKIDILLEIQDINGISKSVAVGITRDAQRANAKLSEINSESFSNARKALKVDKHWIMLIGRVEYYPSDDELIDTCLKSIDSAEECSLIIF